MSESPPVLNSGGEQAVEDSVEKATPGTFAAEIQNQKRLGLKEFIITLIIIFLVWAARRFFGH